MITFRRQENQLRISIEDSNFKRCLGISFSLSGSTQQSCLFPFLLHCVVINCCVKSCSEILLFPWHFNESNWSPGLLQGWLRYQSWLSSCCFRRIIYGKRAKKIGLLLRTWEWRKMNRTGGCKLNETEVKNNPQQVTDPVKLLFHSSLLSLT